MVEAQTSALVKDVVSNAGLIKTDTVIQTFWTHADMNLKNGAIVLDDEQATPEVRTDFVVNAIDITTQSAFTAASHWPQDRGIFRFVSSGFSSCPIYDASSMFLRQWILRKNC